MFKIFIDPLYRLASSLLRTGGRDEIEELWKHRKVRWKKFCMLPITTANRIVEKFITKDDFAERNEEHTR